MNKRVTINRINSRIEYLGYEIVRGQGYFYFFPFSPDAIQIPEQGVYGGVNRLSEMTVEQWHDTLSERIADVKKYLTTDKDYSIIFGKSTKE